MFSANFTTLSNKAKSIFSGETNINKVADGFFEKFVAVPQDQNLDGFQFSFTEEESLEVITEYSKEVLSDGETISQYSVNKPFKYKIKGFVCDVEYNTSKLELAQEKVNSGLGIVGTYAPSITGEAQELVNKVANTVTGGLSYLDNAIQSGKNIAEITGFSENTAKTNTEKMRDIIINLQKFNQRLNVSIFGRTVPDMFITYLNISRKTDIEGGVLHIELELEQQFFAKTKFTSLSEKELESFYKDQVSSVSDKGLSKGKETDLEGFLFKQIN